MKTVEFAKKHTYGGRVFDAGDKLTLAADRAARLDRAGVLKKPAKKSKAD